jgi:hypothetical protein
MRNGLSPFHKSRKFIFIQRRKSTIEVEVQKIQPKEAISQQLSGATNQIREKHSFFNPYSSFLP